MRKVSLASILATERLVDAAGIKYCQFSNLPSCVRLILSVIIDNGALNWLTLVQTVCFRRLFDRWLDYEGSSRRFSGRGSRRRE